MLHNRVQTVKRMQTLAGLLKESFADRIAKQKGEEDVEMEEGFADRIKAKKAQEQELDPTMQKIMDACKKEAGKEYEVFSSKEYSQTGEVYITPKNLGSGVVGRIIGAKVTDLKPNGTVLVGATNGTVDSRGTTHIQGEKKFNVNDMEGILDYVALVLSKMGD